MATVLAAIDNSAAARPVLAIAKAVGALFTCEAEAVHVREDGDLTAVSAAREAGVPLLEARGPVIESLARAAGRGEVALLVLGARGVALARRPAGHVALELITTLVKPLVVVPPDVVPVAEVRRALVPLDGTRATAEALAAVFGRADCSNLELVVLHVHDPESVPPFSDQPQYEVDAWRSEFLARYCAGLAHVRDVEIRVGRPGESVLEVARQTAPDLIALGWSQDLSPGRAAVVREVLARSAAPVLLVPLSAGPIA